MKTSFRLTILATTFALACSSLAAAQGTRPAPKTAKPPAKTAPAQKKPPAAPATVAPAPAPAPAPPSDVRYKSTYTTDDQVTASATFISGSRERYELGDMILLKQPDQKRTIQISRASNTYLVSPEGIAATPSKAPTPTDAPPGIVNVAVSIVDTGERKTAFGQQARHVKRMIDRQPQPGACDPTKMRIETDAWFIDLPKAMAAPVVDESMRGATGCADEIKITENGDPLVLGFPISYRTTFIAVDDKAATPMVVSMEVTEFEVLKLDAELFEIPAGMTAAMNLGELSKAVSDANEMKLANETLATVAPPKKAGTLRVAVPEVANKTAQTVDTRALRSRLVAELEENKIEAIPMAAAAPAALDARATELGVDYLLMAEVTDLKASKPGGLTKIMKSTAGESAGKDITEAKLSVQLVPPGGKARLSKTSSGKDGGIGLKTGLGLAKFAGTMYLKMYLGGMYGSPMGAMNTFRMMNLGGMGGMLGNPALMELQYMGATRIGVGADRTAGAASFIMQQAMLGAAAAAAPPGGPSFDAALEHAVEDAGKGVVESIQKAVVKR